MKYIILLLLNLISYVYPIEIPNVNVTELREHYLEQHNVFRSFHKVGNLTYSLDLEKSAQQFAEILAAKGSKLYHSGTKKTGENLSYGSTNIIKKRGVLMWYEEVLSYNFENHESLENNGCKHFTQLVWKSSVKIGFGLANNGSRVYLVSHYQPRGNIIKRYDKNVFPNSTELEKILAIYDPAYRTTTIKSTTVKISTTSTSQRTTTVSSSHNSSAKRKIASIIATTNTPYITEIVGTSKPTDILISTVNVTTVIISTTPTVTTSRTTKSTTIKSVKSSTKTASIVTTSMSKRIETSTKRKKSKTKRITSTRKVPTKVPCKSCRFKNFIAIKRIINYE